MPAFLIYKNGCVPFSSLDMNNILCEHRTEPQDFYAFCLLKNQALLKMYQFIFIN